MNAGQNLSPRSFLETLRLVAWAHTEDYGANSKRYSLSSLRDGWIKKCIVKSHENPVPLRGITLAESYIVVSIGALVRCLLKSMWTVSGQPEPLVEIWMLPTKNWAVPQSSMIEEWLSKMSVGLNWPANFLRTASSFSFLSTVSLIVFCISIQPQTNKQDAVRNAAIPMNVPQAVVI